MDCKVGPTFGPRGVIMLVTSDDDRTDKTKDRDEGDGDLSFMEEAELVQRRVGHREEWI